MEPRAGEAPVLGAREAERLAALRRYEVLDTPEEEAFDRIVRLAAAVFGTPIADVSLVDERRQWLKARVVDGRSFDGPREAPRGWSLCARAIQAPGVTVVPDARRDERFRSSPFVRGEPHIRFYAGAPLRTPDGHSIGTLCVISPEPRPDGFGAGDQAKLQALADLVVTELELRRRRRGDAQLLNRLLESSTDCIKVLSLDGELESMNEGGQAAMEVDDFRACRGRPWPGFWEGEARARLLAALDEARGGRTGRFEGQASSMKGTPKWWDVTVSPILGEDGKPERLLAISRDVTERKRVEEQLRRGEARLRALVSASSEALYSMSPDWAEMRRLTGGTFLADAEAPNRAWLDEYIPEDERPRVLAAVREALRTKGVFELEHRVRLADGGLGWTLSRAVPLLDPAGEITEWFGAASDVTARKDAEAALREANATLEERVAERTAELRRAVDALHAEAQERGRAEAALRQAQKMEAVGQLTGGIAHDFNNLLTGITGSLELMQNRIRQGRVGDVERYVAAAQGAAKRAAALTHRLLAFSRRQTLDPKPVDVNRLVAGMEELVRRTVGPAIAVETVAVGGLWTTLVDPGQLENALLNLCINARDAMPDGGRLTVETANRWLDERAARSRDLPPGQYVSLCVSDTGCGMPPDVVARAFDPFFTTKPAGLGTGLGLSMVHGFARQSGGQVRIYSEPGQGAMVCLYLPRHHGDGEAEEDGAAAEAVAPRAEQGETVLVVDDEPTVRMLVSEVLEGLGYAALEAGDGPAGLRVLQSGARVDLLITDVGLPGGLNGRQVADAGRALRPGLRVLFITGYAENAAVGNGHLGPGMHVLTKPFAMDALATRIRSVLEGG